MGLSEFFNRDGQSKDGQACTTDVSDKGNLNVINKDYSVRIQRRKNHCKLQYTQRVPIYYFKLGVHHV